LSLRAEDRLLLGQIGLVGGGLLLLEKGSLVGGFSLVLIDSSFVRLVESGTSPSRTYPSSY
jgi:hypothetical protein